MELTQIKKSDFEETIEEQREPEEKEHRDDEKANGAQSEMEDIAKLTNQTETSDENREENEEQIQKKNLESEAQSFKDQEVLKIITDEQETDRAEVKPVTKSAVEQDAAIIEVDQLGDVVTFINQKTFDQMSEMKKKKEAMKLRQTIKNLDILDDSIEESSQQPEDRRQGFSIDEQAYDINKEMFGMFASSPTRTRTEPEGVATERMAIKRFWIDHFHCGPSNIVGGHLLILIILASVWMRCSSILTYEIKISKLYNHDDGFWPVIVFISTIKSCGPLCDFICKYLCEKIEVDVFTKNVGYYISLFVTLLCIFLLLDAFFANLILRTIFYGFLGGLFSSFVSALMRFFNKKMDPNTIPWLENILSDMSKSVALLISVQCIPYLIVEFTPMVVRLMCSSIVFAIIPIYYMTTSRCFKHQRLLEDNVNDIQFWEKLKEGTCNFFKKIIQPAYLLCTITTTITTSISIAYITLFPSILYGDQFNQRVKHHTDNDFFISSAYSSVSIGVSSAIITGILYFINALLPKVRGGKFGTAFYLVGFYVLGVSLQAYKLKHILLSHILFGVGFSLMLHFENVAFKLVHGNEEEEIKKSLPYIEFGSGILTILTYTIIYILYIFQCLKLDTVLVHSNLILYFAATIWGAFYSAACVYRFRHECVELNPRFRFLLACCLDEPN